MKKSIIVSGVYAQGIGLSNLMINLVRCLNSSFQVVCIGFDPDKKDDEIVKSELYGCDMYMLPVKGTAHLFKIDKTHIEAYINAYNPICIITLGPVMFNRYLLVLLQEYRDKLRIISYISFEGRLVDVNFLKYIRLIDYCVFYTECVYDDFNRLLLENPMSDFGYGAVKSTHIGHGVDKTAYYPMPAENDKERRKRSREMIYSGYPVDEDSFVVLNLNRPSHRKNIESTIEGFKQFAAGKENVYLHLHIGTTMSAVRQKYCELVEKAGLTRQVIITPGPDDVEVKSWEWLNNLYNACEIGITTSSGEGWGNGLFEHAATKAAIIAPEHTSFRENWKNAAILLPCAEEYFVFYEYSNMFYVRPEEVCESLNALYFDRNLLEKISSDCFKRAIETRFDWEDIAGKFRQIILS